MNRFLEGCEKLSDGRYRLHEKHTISLNDVVDVRHSPRPIEESEGSEYRSKKKYILKVWQENSSNKNGRKYDPIFENVLKEKPVTMGLVDHPKGDEDGNPKDIYAVQSNPHMRDGWLCIENVFVGEDGRKAEEILENGGFISISSSALGQVDHEGCVMQEGFELERFGDWVMNPSNGVRHFEDDSKMSESTSSKENLTISSKDALEENKIVNSKEKVIMSDTNKLIEQSLVTNIKSLIKESKKIENLPERIAYLKEDVIPSFGDIDSEKLIELKESVVKDIQGLEKEVGEKLSDLEESTKSKDEQIETLTEKEQTLNEQIEKYKTVIENLKKQLVITKSLAKKNESSKDSEKLSILERDNQELMEKILEMGKKDKKKEQDDDEEAPDDEEDSEEDSEEKTDEKADKKSSKRVDKKKKESSNRSSRNINEQERKEMGERIQERSKIREYFEDMEKQNPIISEIKQDVKKAKGLEEAQTMILKFIDEKASEGKKTVREAIENRGNRPKGSVKKTVSQVLHERRSHIG